MHVAMRRFWVRPGSFDEFERLSRERIWPNAESAGLRIRALLRAQEAHSHPDAPAEAEMAVLFTQYVDRAHLRATRSPSDDWRGPERLRRRNWDSIQERQALCYASDATHMERCPVSVGEPRWSYGGWQPSTASNMPDHAPHPTVDGVVPDESGGLIVLRRFWIERGGFAEFERLSVDYIWPAIEALGARIIGLYRAETPHPHPSVEGECDMVVLMTHYTGHPHWLSTRAGQDTWRGPDAVRQHMLAGTRPRHAMTLATEATFTSPCRVPVGGPFFVFQHDQD